MPIAQPFTYDVEKSGDEATGRVTRITLHGKLLSENSAELKALIRPMIASGGRILVDFSDVSHVDSSGLGALVILKMASVKEGYGTLEFEHFSDRVRSLVDMTNLTELFKSHTAV